MAVSGVLPGNPLALAVVAARDAHAKPFTRADWNRIQRLALVAAGRHWIARYLPSRFGDDAYDLGYHAKKMDREEHDATALSRALSSGVMDQLAAQYAAGWNPWRSPFPPNALFQGWLRYQRGQGRFLQSRSGEWRTARRELRAHIKELLRAKLAQLPAGQGGRLVPLVHTGALRQAALTQTKARATATASRAQVRITIPQPHPTHPIVGKVLRTATPDEVDAVAGVYVAEVNALVAGATSTTSRRGTVRSRLTPAQRAAAGRLLYDDRRRAAAKRLARQARQPADRPSAPAIDHTPRAVPT